MIWFKLILAFEFLIFGLLIWKDIKSLEKK